MNNVEMICVQLITAVGSARSCYIEAIRKARNGEMEDAQALMEEGRTYFNDGHKAHADLLALDADNQLERIPLLLLHAEDQLMSAENFGILAEEFIETYKSLNR